MSDVKVVSRERHANLTWRRPANFSFAAKDPVVVLVAQEVPRAMLHLPLGFIESGDMKLIVAVQGFKPGQNKLVSNDGRWLVDHVPTAYRAHPFSLARNQEGVEVLCIDEAAGQVSGTSSGEAFFLPDGTPAPAVAELMRMFAEIEKDRQRTQRACETLAKHDLFEPWPIKAQDGDHALEASGILRIAETKLYALEPQALAEVRNAGGLMLAFAQLFSMQQIHKLGQLGASSAKPAPAAAPKLTDENGIISFANL